jgi:N-methylhydantoinase A
LDAFNAKAVNKLLQHMTADARAVVEPALGGAKATVQVIADCRYVGQGHEIRISVPLKTLVDTDGAKLKAAFEAQYEQVYGLRIPNQEAEAITWSVTVSSIARKPTRAKNTSGKSTPKPRSKRLIYDPALGKQVMASVYWRFDMKPGAALKGPAIIAEDETSTIVGANFKAKINSLGYIILENLR